MALVDGWNRFWYEGELLPIAADTVAAQEKDRQKIIEEKKRADNEKKRADREKQLREEEAKKVALLAEKLRSLGIDPEI